MFFYFSFTTTPRPPISTLSLHDALPISIADPDRATLIEQICYGELGYRGIKDKPVMPVLRDWLTAEQLAVIDRKSTRLNSSHTVISYAVFCLKKKKKKKNKIKQKKQRKE